MHSLIYTRTIIYCILYIKQANPAGHFTSSDKLTTTGTIMERKANMPLWVFLALMNIENRKGALILFRCSLAFMLFCIPLSYYLDDWWWLGMMVPITLWYWLSLQWVDKHSTWG